MNKERKEYTDVARFLGKAFVRLPRKVLNMFIHPAKKERHLANIYIALITRAFFVDGTVTLGRHKHVCRRGEYVGTYQELSTLTCISRGSIGYYLRLLETDHLIVTNTITGGTRIGICGYDYFSGYEMETNKQQPIPQPGHTLADIEQKMGGRSMQNMDAKPEGSDA